MSNATAILNAYVPSAVHSIEGRNWLTFANEGTFAAFKSMPNALRYEDKVYIKKGWNSDTHFVHYAEGEAAIAA